MLNLFRSSAAALIANTSASYCPVASTVTMPHRREVLEFSAREARCALTDEVIPFPAEANLVDKLWVPQHLATDCVHPSIRNISHVGTIGTLLDANHARWKAGCETSAFC